MDAEREPEDQRTGIKKSVVGGDRGRVTANTSSHADTPSVCDDAPPPPKHQKEDNENEQRVESINLGDGRIRPEGAGEGHEQPRAERRGQHQEAAPGILIGLSLDEVRSCLFAL